jgi:predicted DNA-binding WGR domain protein
MTTIYLQRIDPERNMARFYRITVTPTLFGEWALIREWGRIGSPGTVRETWYDDEAAACRAGEQRVQQKLRRGYGQW